MNIKYLLNGVKLSEKEDEYLEKRIKKVGKFFKNCKQPDELRLEVDINQDKKTFWRVEIMLRTPRKTFRVEKINKEFMMTVDDVMEALLKQLRRYKDKMVTISRNG